MKQSNKGNRKQCLAARAMAVVLMLVLVGTTTLGSALALEGNKGKTTDLLLSSVAAAKIVIKNSSGTVVSGFDFVGGKDKGSIPTQTYTISGISGKTTVSVSANWIRAYMSGSTLVVGVDSNYTGKKRSGTVTVKNGNNTVTAKVTQDVFNPSLYAYGYLFGDPTVSSNLTRLYRPFAEAEAVDDIQRMELFNLAWEAAKVLKIEFPKEFYFGTEAELLHVYGFTPYEIGGLISGYDKEHDCVFINLSKAKTPEDLAKAVFHELRHKWQKDCNGYNAGRTQYLIKYGVLHYTNPTDWGQITEVDARGYADRMVDVLNKKVK